MRIELNGYNPMPSIMAFATENPEDSENIIKNAVLELFKAGITIESVDEQVKILSLLSDTLIEHIERKYNVK